MNAKEQYEYFQSYCAEIRTERDKGIASWLLTLPIPMSYEVWWYLHTIKGDV